jgi:hypothetical protein
MSEHLVPVEVPCEWDDSGNPVNWMLFSRTHLETELCRQGCVIHHRTAHHMRWWPLRWRRDRAIFERICDCGIGHPDPDQGPWWAASGQDWQWVHGCCGCCGDPQPPFEPKTVAERLDAAESGEEFGQVLLGMAAAVEKKWVGDE